MYKLDANNKIINIDLCIYFNNKLSSDKALQRPFVFTMPLNFSAKEQVHDLTVSFDHTKVMKYIKIEDFKEKLLGKDETPVINEDNMYDQELDLDRKVVRVQ